MPWRGPEEPGEYPTLGYLVADWIESACAIPDRHLAGERFRLTDEQLAFLLRHYRLDPAAIVDLERPSAPFRYVGSVMVRPQKWGKGPLTAALICAEAAGPVLFDGWDADGEPVGRPWPTPHVQVTAVSEDQTDNVWRALLPMIELGEIAADIDDTGLTRINLPNRGLIEPVTASARSRLGQRITFAVQDETHSWLARNGGHRLADTQRRNLAGTGGRWVATTNAYDPAERSVAQTDVEVRLPDVYVDYPDPLPGSWRNRRDRRRILRHAYAGAPWVDLDRIESDCDRLAAKGEPGQAERFFGNRVVARADAAFDPRQWAELAEPGRVIPAGAQVALGFDGARHHDATALVATEVDTGYQVVVGIWQRPADLLPDDDWSVPEAEVTEAVAACFDRWDVFRLLADPPYWTDTVAAWAGRFTDRRGRSLVQEYWTNVRRTMAHSLSAYRQAVTDGTLRHDGDPVMAEHIANARRVPLPGSYDAEGHPMWLIGKDRPDSPRKIDAAMAGCLSWQGRLDALAAGDKRRRKRPVFAGF